MSMYIPEIKEEVSENAKMLVEDGGKIVRTTIPKKLSELEIDTELGVKSWNDLEDKPFSEETIVSKNVLFYGTVNSHRYDFHPNLGLEVGAEYLIVIDGVEYIGVCQSDSPDVYVDIEGIGLLYDYAWDSSNMETIGTLEVYTQTVKTTLKQIDSKYLPEHLQFGKQLVYSDTLTWDGITEGYENVINNGVASFVKISDSTPTLDELSSNNCTLSGGYSKSLLFYQSTDNVVSGNEPMFVIYEDNVEYNGMLFPAKGIYFGLYSGYYIAKFTIENYQFQTIGTKQIDAKYLPDTYITVTITSSYNTDIGDIVYSCDKTYDEMYEAINAGIEVQFSVGGSTNITHGILLSSGNICVEYVTNSNYTQYLIQQDNTVSRNSTDLITKKNLQQETGTAPLLTMSQRAITNALNTKLTTPITAEVGQTLVVKAVDENGKPTEWECADVSSGGKSYFVDWNNGYGVSEEAYNAFVNYLNDPTVGFPDVSVLCSNNYHAKITAVRSLSFDGSTSYLNYKGVRCHVALDGNTNMFVIAATQSDANGIENTDMA